MHLSAIARYSAGVSATGNLMWKVSTSLAKVFDGQAPTPQWSEQPLPRASERFRPELQFPRATNSICPKCNREAARAVLNGERSLDYFRENPGVVEAQLIEEAGQILMRKICPQHGPFEDVVSRDSIFTNRMNSLYFGRDFSRVCKSDSKNEGPLTVETGRGSFLIVDLTNRCNMKCDPCFMDANNLHYVHEMGIEDVRRVFDHAQIITPKRELAILFSGGEPTIAPVFLDAIKYAKQSGFSRLLAATNGIKLAEDPDFAKQARAAGLQGVYLQLDGVTNEDNWHRGIANFFDIKRRALENISSAGMRATLQVTVINGLNDHRVGEIARFAIENADVVQGIVFQPIMFAGRDADISDEDRYEKRYTLSDLAHGLNRQLGGLDPLRDWFPMSAYSGIAHVLDQMNPEAKLGSVYADVHPHHGTFSPLIVNSDTKQFLPLSEVFNVDGFLSDLRVIGDTFVGPQLTKLQIAASVMRHFRAAKAPSGLTVGDLKHVVDDMRARFNNQVSPAVEGRQWRLMLMAGMWFQDLFNMDLTAIQMSSTLVAANPDGESGEISFCAYNAAAWRSMNEQLHPTAGLAQWHRAYGRHAIYANGKLVNISGYPQAIAVADHPIGGISEVAGGQPIASR